MNASGKPADRESQSQQTRVKIADIAALAGVDKSTVSRALNPATAHRVAPATTARIKNIAATHGYVPDETASALRVGKTRSMGVLVPEVTDPHTALVTRGIQEYLIDQGISAVVMETRDSPATRDTALRFLTSRRMDCLIVLSARNSDEDVLVELAKQQPVVLCVRDVPASGLPSVTCDDFLGGSMAARYLGQLGHETVAFLTQDTDIEALRRRRDGFLRTAEGLGIEVVEISGNGYRFGPDEGRRLVGRLLSTSQKDLPTAIFAVADAMAFGVISALNDSRMSCPQDMSVIGFDDSPLCEYMLPSLTTIAVPAYDVGQRAAAMAVSAVVNGEGLESQVLSPELIIRESTGKLTR